MSTAAAAGSSDEDEEDEDEDEDEEAKADGGSEQGGGGGGGGRAQAAAAEAEGAVAASGSSASSQSVFDSRSASCRLLQWPAPSQCPLSVSGQLLDADFPMRVYGCFSHVVAFVSSAMQAAAQQPQQTQQRRFASMVKVLSWIRKLCRGNRHFLRALALSLCQPFQQPPPDAASYEDWLQQSPLLSFLSSPAAFAAAAASSPPSCLDVLLSFCSVPGPVCAASRLDRVLSEMMQALLTVSWQQPDAASAASLSSPLSSFPCPAVNIKSFLLSGYVRHYRALFVSRSKLPPLVSVQLLPVPAFVPQLMAQRAVQTVAETLRWTLQQATSSRLSSGSSGRLLPPPAEPPPRVLDCRHPCLLHQRHYNLKIDLIYLLRHPALAAELWTAADAPPAAAAAPCPASPSVLELLLDILSELQSMNPIARLSGSAPHVPYESEDWQYAFEVEHDMQQIWELPTNALRPPSSRPAQSLPRLLRCLTGLCWLLSRDVALPAACVSFHLPLHRLFARLTVLALQHSGDALQLLNGCLQRVLAADSAPASASASASPAPPSPLSEWWREFVTGPLRLAGCVAEMRARLWLRNGDSIIGQQACYRSPSFALPGLYADVAALQLAAVSLAEAAEADLAAMAVEAFHLSPFLSAAAASALPLSDAQLVTLSEDCCRLLLAVVTDRTLLVPDAVCIRSELLHCLAAHPQPTHSALLTSLPEPLSRSAVLPVVDAALSELSEFLPPVGTRGGCFTIRQSGWTEFNPAFYRFMPQETATAEDRHRQALEAAQQRGGEQAEAEAEADDERRLQPRAAPSFPPCLSWLSLLLHRPALYRLLATVLQSCCAALALLPLPAEAEAEFPMLSPLSCPASSSLDRLLQSALQLLALSTLTAPPAPLPLASGSLPLRDFPTFASSPPSTCACLPSVVQHAARICRRRRQQQQQTEATPATAEGAAAFRSPLPSAASVASVSASEAARIHRSLTALGFLLHWLSAAQLTDTQLPRERRAQMDDVLTLMTQHCNLSLRSPAAAPPAAAAAARSAPAQPAPSASSFSAALPVSPAPLSSSSSSSSSSSFSSSRSAAKARQAALLRQFALRQSQFQLTLQRKQATLAEVAAAVSSSPSPPPLSRSPSPPPLPLPATQPQPPPTAASAPPAPGSAPATAAGAAFSSSSAWSSPLGLSADAACCLCHDGCSGERLLGRVSLLHLSGLLTVQHRQQMQSLRDRMLLRPQHRSLLPTHCHPRHPEAAGRQQQPQQAREDGQAEQPPQPDLQPPGSRARRRPRQAEAQAEAKAEDSGDAAPRARKRQRSGGQAVVTRLWPAAEAAAAGEEAKAASGPAAAASLRSFSRHPSVRDSGFDLLHHRSAAAAATSAPSASAASAASVPALLLSSCGHLLHFDCYRGYLRSLHPALGSSSASPSSLQLSFPCPACRRMANALMPLPDTGAETETERAPAAAACLSAVRSPSSLPSSCLQQWLLSPPSLSALCASTLQDAAELSSGSASASAFVSELLLLLRRACADFALSGSLGCCLRLLTSWAAHTLLHWELAMRSSGEADAEEARSLSSPQSARCEQMLRLLLLAQQALVSSSQTARRQQLRQLRDVLALCLPDAESELGELEEEAAEEEAEAGPLQPLLSHQPMVVLVRLSPLLFDARSSRLRQLRLSAACSSSPVSLSALVVPLLFLSHVLQSALVVAHLEARALEAAQRRPKALRNGEKDSRRQRPQQQPPQPQRQDEAEEGGGAAGAHYSAQPAVALPALSPSLSELLSACSLTASSPSSLSLLSTCCLADVCCLSSLQLFLRAARLGLLPLPRAYEQHQREQRTRQAAWSSRQQQQRDAAAAPAWLSLVPAASPAAASASSAWCSPLASVLDSLTAAFRQQLRHLHRVFSPHAQQPLWELPPSLSAWDHPHPLSSGAAPCAASGPCFSSDWLSLLYLWLVDWMQTQARDDAEGRQGVDAAAAVRPLTLLPCAGLDLSVPLYLCGLPPVFQTLLASGPARVCPHCQSSRSSFPSPSSVASTLLCLLCGAYCCANNRNRCHLLHVAACEGYKGCFLSLKRGDCVLVRLDQQPRGPAAAAAAPPSPLSLLAPSPVVSLSSYSFCHWPSLYLDAYGESDLNLVRGRPLFLNPARVRALTRLLSSPQHQWEEHMMMQIAAQRQQQQQQLMQQQQQQQHRQQTQQQTQPGPQPPVPAAAAASAAASPRPRASPQRAADRAAER